MIIHDKETEFFLNKQADSWTVMLLCRSGILPAAEFLRAAALFRNDSDWRRAAFRFFKVMSLFSFLLGLALLALSRWDFFYRPGCVAFLAVLLAVCSIFKNKFTFAHYTGTVLIGLLIFSADMIFKTNVFLYQQFFLWTVLIILWESTDRHKKFFLSLIFINISLALYGFQVLIFRTDLSLPAGIGCLIGLNGLFLIAAEKSNFNSVRHTALSFILGGTLILPAFSLFHTELSASLNPIFLICFFLSGAGIFFYSRVRFDMNALRLVMTFVFSWTSMLFYQVVNYLSLPPLFERSSFSLLYSVFIVGCLFFMLKMKERRNG